MKKFLFYLFSIFCFSISLAQTQADSRLQARFSTNAQTAIMNQDSTIIEFWNYFLDNGFYVADLGIKTNDLTDIYSIPAKDPASGLPFNVTNEDPTLATFNVLKFDFQLSEDNFTFYKIDSTQAIIFYSKNVLTQMFNDAQ